MVDDTVRGSRLHFGLNSGLLLHPRKGVQHTHEVNSNVGKCPGTSQRPPGSIVKKRNCLCLLKKYKSISRIQCKSKRFWPFHDFEILWLCEKYASEKLRFSGARSVDCAHFQSLTRVRTSRKLNPNI